MKTILFENISNLYHFSGFAKVDGVRPNASMVAGITDAAILVQDGRIHWWGRRAKVPGKRSQYKKVSLGGGAVLPSFIECHTHLLYAGDRREEFERRNSGETYLEIAQSGGGIQSTVRATKKATTEALMDDLLARLSEFARQGVTVVEIKTGYAGSIQEELRHLKLLLKLKAMTDKSRAYPRVVITCLAAHSLPLGKTESEWLSLIEKELFPFLLTHKIRLDAFIEKAAFSLERTKTLLQNAKKQGLDVVIHADQLSRTGASRLGAELGAKSVDHVIEANDEDIKILATSDTVAVLLPAADLYARLPYPAARRMLDQGVRVALATDHNPGSSPGLDLTFVGLLARTVMQMTLPEVLCAYTYNAARALGLEKECGVLDVGYHADFICLKSETRLTDLFYEIGPCRSGQQIASLWREGEALAFQCKNRS